MLVYEIFYTIHTYLFRSQHNIMCFVRIQIAYRSSWTHFAAHDCDINQSYTQFHILYVSIPISVTQSHSKAFMCAHATCCLIRIINLLLSSSMLMQLERIENPWPVHHFIQRDICIAYNNNRRYARQKQYGHMIRTKLIKKNKKLNGKWRNKYHLCHSNFIELNIN